MLACIRGWGDAGFCGGFLFVRYREGQATSFTSFHTPVTTACWASIKDAHRLDATPERGYTHAHTHIKYDRDGIHRSCDHWRRSHLPILPPNLSLQCVKLTDESTGLHGLISAKTYLEVNPHANVLIIEKSATIGGVWAQHRLCPGLNTNNLLGTYEYSDFPMIGDNAFGVQPGQHIPGHVVHEYLSNFALHYDLLKRCRFAEEIRTAQKLASDTAGGWTLVVQKLTTAETYRITTNKLIVATGVASKPSLPEFAGAPSFGVPIFHYADLRQHTDELLKRATNVVVFGGTKSGWDAAYAFAMAGVHVDWIIRESGHGPSWMSPPYLTSLKKMFEKLVATRFLTWFSPCVWGDADGFSLPRRFLHQTRIGRFVTRRFWGSLTTQLIAVNGYDAHPETAKLKPWVDAFWVGTGLGILNYPTNFFDLVRSGKISVHIRDIDHLSSETVHLAPSSAASGGGASLVV